MTQNQAFRVNHFSLYNACITVQKGQMTNAFLLHSELQSEDIVTIGNFFYFWLGELFLNWLLTVKSETNEINASEVLPSSGVAPSHIVASIGVSHGVVGPINSFLRARSWGSIVAGSQVLLGLVAVPPH